MSPATLALETEALPQDEALFAQRGLDPTPVTILTTLNPILPDSVSFTLEVPMDGVQAGGSKIVVNQSNANLSLQITLDPAQGFTFQSPAILWVAPPQDGYSSNPFGKEPIYPLSPWVAAIPNSTGKAGSGMLTTQFALVLDGPRGFTAVIDPTIVDDPNT